MGNRVVATGMAIIGLGLASPCFGADSAKEFLNNLSSCRNNPNNAKMFPSIKLMARMQEAEVAPKFDQIPECGKALIKAVKADATNKWSTKGSACNSPRLTQEFIQTTVAVMAIEVLNESQKIDINKLVNEVGGSQQKLVQDAVEVTCSYVSRAWIPPR